MQYVTETVNLPKELNEVRTCVTELLKDLFAKKSLAVIAGENLPALAAAVDGAANILAEAKDDKKAAAKCVALMVSEVIAEFL